MEAKLMKAIKEVNESDLEGLTPINSPFVMPSSPAKQRPTLVKQKRSFHEDDEKDDLDEVKAQIPLEDLGVRNKEADENPNGDNQLIQTGNEKDPVKPKKKCFLGLSGEKFTLNWT